MKNIVSFETAKKLKEAGYPQPDFETGQVWYDLDGTPLIKLRRAFQFLNLESGGLWILDVRLEKRFYAPSATEIIGQISITWSSANLYCCYDGDSESEYWEASDLTETMSGVSENPAEAAAELYIKMNSK